MSESGEPTELDDIVARLAAVTDALIRTDTTEFAERYRLQTERDALRVKAAEFTEHKDERRSTPELEAELAARISQLKALRKQRINMTYQSAGGGPAQGHVAAIEGGTINDAVMTGQGAAAIEMRIAEIGQELDRRALAAD